MKAMTGPAVPARVEFRLPAKHRGLAAIGATFVVAVALVNFVSPSRLSYADIHSLADVGAPLALASIGQTITVLVTPTPSGLQPTVTLLDPSASTIGSATAAVAGQPAMLQTVATTTGGTYTISVGGAGSTTGGFDMMSTNPDR